MKRLGLQLLDLLSLDGIEVHCRVTLELFLGVLNDSLVIYTTPRNKYRTGLLNDRMITISFRESNLESENTSYFYSFFN